MSSWRSTTVKINFFMLADTREGSPLPRLADAEVTGAFAGMKLPFILQGNMSVGWGALASHWSESLASRFTDGIAEVEYGSREGDRRRVLTRLPTALHEALSLHRGEEQRADHPYVIFQLPPPRWRRLEEDGSVPPRASLPFAAHAWERCLDGLQAPLAAEWHLKARWSQVVAGGPGTGMPNHTDTLHVSGWHAHLSGRKWWRLCGRGPEGGAPACFEGVLAAGEVLAIPAGWWHETRCLEETTVSLSQLIVPVPAASAATLVEQVAEDCAFGHAANLRLSAALCDAWDGCAAEVHHAQRRDDDPSPWLTWRERIERASVSMMAARRAIRRREEVLPSHYTFEALAMALNRDYYERQGVEIRVGAAAARNAGPAR